MYFPYLRGKQFELIALRELSGILNPDKVIPIIEPLKRNTKGVETAISALAKKGIRVQLIVNPQYGDLVARSNEVISLIEHLTAAGATNVIPTFLVNTNKDQLLVANTISEQGYDQTGYSLIHLNQIGATDELSVLAKTTNCLYNMIQINQLFALQRKYRPLPLAFLNDPFTKRQKNADYLDPDDEIFSSDYLYYREEGYVAFGDYLTIGEDFVDGGMLPRAVAIHLTYKDEGGDDIRIHHFVSDTNDDYNDPAGKFYEALTKLIVFVDAAHIDSVAVRQFQDYYDRQAFPGLGVIKKLSIMHHIELVQSLI
ncbi:sce7725 family protein [Parapedobacter tibetensis]|uniref:sce7725 family protein n=1 Tax=Parapedobacter tibetensis TaxID=2972951 RepID=UPI00214DBDE1|nr:sce7725 family protein [Parapedobacter tibetensis]